MRAIYASERLCFVCAFYVAALAVKEETEREYRVIEIKFRFILLCARATHTVCLRIVGMWSFAYILIFVINLLPNVYKKFSHDLKI